MQTIYTNRDHLTGQRVSSRNSSKFRHWWLLPLLPLALVWLLWPSAQPSGTSEKAAAAAELVTVAADDPQNAALLPDDPQPDPPPTLGAVEDEETPDDAAGPEDGSYDAHIIDPDADDPAATPEIMETEKLFGPQSLAREESGAVQSGETLTTALLRYELAEDTANLVYVALRGIYDFRKLKSGTRFSFKLDVLGNLESFELFESPLETYYVRPEGNTYEGYKITGETTMYVEQISGVIEQSLAHSIWALGEGEALTAAIASIFVWDIDFFSDLQKGDEWHILVEKHYYKGKFIRYGDVLCAKLVGRKIGTRYAYYFDAGEGAYYDDSGYAMEKSFLRAPLDTTRVTSKWGYRMHPTLGKRQKHNGVDYGAPSGTPIWAISSGTVLAAGWMGPCGRGAKIRHEQGYESIYCHMNSIAVRPGQKVRQKTMVGRVGCSGRCTGPHLHFGLKHNGAFINPLSVKYLPSKKVAGTHVDRWKLARALLKGKLDAMEAPVFYGPPRPPDYEPPQVAAAPAPPQPKPEAAPATRPRAQSSGKGFRPRPEGIKAVRVPRKR